MQYISVEKKCATLAEQTYFDRTLLNTINLIW